MPIFNRNCKEKGQGLVEYALILVLIAIVVIVAMRALGTKVSDTFETVNTELAGEGGAGGAEEAAGRPTCESAGTTGGKYLVTVFDGNTWYWEKYSSSEEAQGLVNIMNSHPDWSYASYTQCP